MARTPKATPPVGPQAQAGGPITLSGPQIALVFGINERTVRDLSEKGLIVKASRGRYELVKSVQLYTKHLRDIASRHEDESQGVNAILESALLKRSQRERYEAETKIKLGELLPVSEYEEVSAAIISSIKGMIMAWPGMLHARLPHLTSHDIGEATAVAREVLTDASIVKWEADKLPPPIGDRVRRQSTPEE